MKKSQRENCSGRTFLWPLVAVAAFLVLSGVAVWQIQPERMVLKRQQALYQGIEKRSAARMRRLVSDDYRDAWNFTADDLVEAMLDGGSSFLTLMVTPENTKVEKRDGVYVVEAVLRLGGKAATPVGTEVMRTINKMDQPFRFHWKKESFVPSSWKLIRVENEQLPLERYQYTPGDLRRSIRGE